MKPSIEHINEIINHVMPTIGIVLIALTSIVCFCMIISLIYEAYCNRICTKDAKDFYDKKFYKPPAFKEKVEK